MSEILSIPISSLLLAAENPRLVQPNVGQRDALRSLATQQHRKLVTLAKDIVQHGINPTELPIVIRKGDDLGRYVVLEGNRRLAALKSLENPESLVGALQPTDLAENGSGVSSIRKIQLNRCNVLSLTPNPRDLILTIRTKASMISHKLTDPLSGALVVEHLHSVSGP